MTCRHTTILVVRERSSKLRCEQCHLTLDEEDLVDGDCPECLEETGRSFSDFERVPNPEKSLPVYRCDECGAILWGDG